MLEQSPIEYTIVPVSHDDVLSESRIATSATLSASGHTVIRELKLEESFVGDSKGPRCIEPTAIGRLAPGRRAIRRLVLTQPASMS